MSDAKHKEVIQLPAPTEDQRAYLRRIVEWERESMEPGVLIRGAAREKETRGDAKTLDESFNELSRAALRVKAERDALLEAAKEALAWHDSVTNSMTGRVASRVPIAAALRAAIDAARAKEEQDAG